MITESALLKNIQTLTEAEYYEIDALGAYANDLVVSIQVETAEQARALLNSLDHCLHRNSSAWRFSGLLAIGSF